MQISKRALMWSIIAILFIAALFFVFQAGAGNVASATGQVVSAGQSASQSASNAMVGGC